jgi:signal transduction histidine kinase
VLEKEWLARLGVLAGGIAHDFNNLLTGMFGNASLAMMRIPADSPARVNLQNIETASQRASELCQQMLAYSGRGKFLTESLDLSELVEEMLTMLEMSISKKAELRVDLAHELPAIEADATQIRQIVMNLITNASDALEGEKGSIRITTGVLDCDRGYLNDSYLDDGLTEGRYVFVEVTDSGCGIERETLGKTFDPFYTTKLAGRGLGMAAVLGIVRGHRGAIRLRSEPGRGTTIRSLFPVADQSAAASIDAEPQAQELGRRVGRVLVVDDAEGCWQDLAVQIAAAMMMRISTPPTIVQARVVLEALPHHSEKL